MGTSLRMFHCPLSGLVSVAAAMTPALGSAQESAPPGEERPATALETVVVTGSALSSGVTKLEASYNIVTANEEQIRQSNPKSTADLLKIAPGLWPESTGGQTGANIAIAGFPSGGDAPYYTTLLMGSPLYGMPTLSFFETTSIFRLDDTVRSVEILQGGPSVVFAGGQMGATSNFFLKTGTDEPSGSVGLTWGDEDLWRFDGFTGFKLADQWYGSIGGFWRTSEGVRDPQFPADEGGQITATLKREGDRGDLILYARYLNDKNQFITPIPMIQRGRDHFSAYPGFDPRTGTYYSNALRRVRLDGAPEGPRYADLADGRGADMVFFGLNFDYEFDNGWSISEKFLFNSGDVDTNALFSGSNPALLGDQLFNIPTDLGGLGVPAGAVVNAAFVGGGAVPFSQDVIHQGWWSIHKKLEHFNNDLRLSKELFDGNTLTIGLYTAYYTMDDKWALGNQMLMTNEVNARPITVSYTLGGQTYFLTDEQGFLDNGTFNVAQRGHAFNKAIYLSDIWQIGKWLLDASVRWENQEATNRVCNESRVDLDGDPLTLYNNDTWVCNGITATDYDEDFTSWTVGANYSFTDSMSAYLRVNRGGHFLDFDNGIRGSTTGNTPPMQVVRNYEVGFKYQNDWLYADISSYFRDFTGLQYQQTDRSGAPTGARLLYGSESYGINFIGTLTPIDNFRFQIVANYLDGEYTDYDACVPYTNVVTGDGCARIEGQQLQRQPKLRYMLTPSYRLPLGFGDVEAFVTYTHIGDRTQDQSGLQELGSYHTWDFGVTAYVGDNWQFTLRGTNVTDEIGITESNSRIFGPAAGDGGVLLARPIEGREINFQAKYLW
jgi:outer membrane receptor protein involved in Fe transport